MPLGMESWFCNFTQFSRSWVSKDSLADIPRPFIEYSVWVTMKTAEVGSLIGGCIVHPVFRMYLKKSLKAENTTPNSHKIIRNKCRKLQGRFLVASVLLGPLVSIAQIKSSAKSEIEMKEMCYDIRCDGPGLTIDRCAVVCGLVGWYWKRFQGAVDGINVGLAYAIFNNNVLAKYTSPMLTDKIGEHERYKSVSDAETHRSRLAQFIAEKDKDGTRTVEDQE